MKSKKYNKPGSKFDGKTLEEILDLVDERPPFVEKKLAEAKKLFERFGYPEKLKAMEVKK